VRVIDEPLPGVKLIAPEVHEDHRGFFMESYNRLRCAQLGITDDFVQDNHSYSARGTLRGLHAQIRHPQGKLVRAVEGEMFDVAVDIRRGSPTFGRWLGVVLSGGNFHQLWIPPGFAHGFCVLSATALFAYKCSDFYAPDCDLGVRWCDPAIGIRWPVADPLLSAKDRQLPLLTDIPPERLPVF